MIVIPPPSPHAARRSIGAKKTGEAPALGLAGWPDHDREACPHPSGQSCPRSVGYLASRIVGNWPASSGRRGEFEGEVQTARRGADTNPDTWRHVGGGR